MSGLTVHAAPRPPHDRAPSATDGVNPIERTGVTVLAKQVHLVAEAGKRLGEAGVVDVAAGAAQQIAMEDQNFDGRQRYCGNTPGFWIGSKP